jgi:hypothetical protein
MLKLSTLEEAASGEHGACSLTANSDSSVPKTAICVLILRVAWLLSPRRELVQ